MEAISKFPVKKCNKETIEVTEAQWEKFKFDLYYCADLSTNKHLIRG